MLPITSKDNDKIKLLKKLQLKKYRDEESLFVVENLKIILDAAASGFKPEQLFLTPVLLAKNELKLKKIIDDESTFLFDEKINKAASTLDTPSGIIAVYQKLPENINLNGRVVYLNGISDPGNIGTILRSALAFRFDNIVLDENCADLYNTKTINAAKDAIFKLNISHDKDSVTLKDIKAKMPIYAADMGGSKKPEYLKSEKSFCLVLGSEAHGISEEIKKLTDNFISISISDKIESLNVAVAAGIIFYLTSN